MVTTCTEWGHHLLSLPIQMLMSFQGNCPKTHPERFYQPSGHRLAQLTVQLAVTITKAQQEWGPETRKKSSQEEKSLLPVDIYTLIALRARVEDTRWNYSSQEFLPKPCGSLVEGWLLDGVFWHSRLSRVQPEWALQTEQPHNLRV